MSVYLHACANKINWGLIPTENNMHTFKPQGQDRIFKKIQPQILYNALNAVHLFHYNTFRFQILYTPFSTVALFFSSAHSTITITFYIHKTLNALFKCQTFIPSLLNTKFLKNLPFIPSFNTSFSLSFLNTFLVYLPFLHFYISGISMYTSLLRELRDA